MHTLYCTGLLFLYTNTKTARSNACLLDPLSSLVELDFLARNQTLLQRTPNAHGGYGPLEAHWRRGVVQAAGCKFIGFGDEGITEPAVVVGRDLATDATGLIDVDQVGCRLRIDGQFACSASDFGGLFSQYRFKEAEKGRQRRQEIEGRRGGLQSSWPAAIIRLQKSWAIRPS